VVQSDIGGGFSAESRSVIERLEAYGWVFTLSKEGHAIGRAPDGETTASVGKKLSRANRSSQNAEAAVRAWERKIGEIDEEDHAKIALLERLEPEVRSHVTVAMALGWVVEQMVNGWPRLRSFDGNHTATLPRERMDRRTRRALRRRVVDYADPTLLAASKFAGDLGDDEFDEFIITSAAGATISFSPRPQPVDEPVDEPGTLETVVMPDQPLVAPVASRRPWLARQGTSRRKGTTSLYESGAVVEVTHVDGSVTYECSIEECDYTSTNPRSVSSHFRGHVQRGDHEPVGQLARPSVARDVPVEDFRPDLGDPESQVREPLTDTQIVERVRLLIGGRDPETEEALRVALLANEALRSEMATLRAEKVAAEAEAARLQGDLDAWLSLAPRANGGA